MSKNIVVLSDGTGQMGGKGYNTNVYKIFNKVEDRTKDQIVFYDAGLGTSGAELLEQVTGLGFSRNLKECYRFIFRNYEAGDQIYLIGFSRGAATVRSLSSFIHHFGILPKSREDLVDQAYKIYKINDPQKREVRAKDFIAKHHTMWASIKFLGCFDTVSALGFPIKNVSALLDRVPFLKHQFHSFKLSKSVENAYHALAIDDERKTFHPVLWDADIEDYQSLQQVWFPGMHTDVGGGYKENGLSDISLNWMCQKAVSSGLRMYGKERFEVTPKADGVMHDSRKGWWQQRVYQKLVRSWPKDRIDKPIIHPCVLERRQKGNYEPWILDIDYEIETMSGSSTSEINASVMNN